MTVVAGTDRADADIRARSIDTHPVVSPYPPSSGARIEPATDVVIDQANLFSTRTRSSWLWMEYQWRRTLSAGVGVRWLEERAITRKLFEQRLSNDACRVVFPGSDFTRPCTEFAPVASSEKRNLVDTGIPIPLAVIEWRPRPEQAVALSHGRGYRSAGTAVDGTYRAEREETTELSWRAHWWDGRIKTAVTLFDGRARDRFVRPIDSTLGLNSGNARIRGAELEVDAELGERWRARAGLGVLEARYTEFRDLDGERTAGAPPQTLSLGLRYGAARSWYGATDFYHAGSAQTGPLTSRPLHLPAYSLLDARVGHRTEHWDAALIATNILDADYIVRVDNAITPTGTTPIRYRLGDPCHLELRVAWYW
jgi:outer membrane receptor protein involved in Fe transport